MHHIFIKQTIDQYYYKNIGNMGEIASILCTSIDSYYRILRALDTLLKTNDVDSCIDTVQSILSIKNRKNFHRSH